VDLELIQIFIVGAIVLALVALTPAVTALIAVGYWGGALNNGLRAVKETLAENLTLIRTDQREMRQDVNALGQRVAKIEQQP
jgi:hypothetical protein